MQPRTKPKQTDSGANGDSLRHTCTLCATLSDLLTPAIAALESSLGTALDRARTEVISTLQRLSRTPVLKGLFGPSPLSLICRSSPTGEQPTHR